MLGSLIGKSNKIQNVSSLLDSLLKLGGKEVVGDFSSLGHEHKVNGKLGGIGGLGERKIVFFLSSSLHNLLVNNGKNKSVERGVLIDRNSNVNVVSRGGDVEEKTENVLQSQTNNVLAALESEVGSQRVDKETTSSKRDVVNGAFRNVFLAILEADLEKLLLQDLSVGIDPVLHLLFVGAGTIEMRKNKGNDRGNNNKLFRPVILEKSLND